MARAPNCASLLGRGYMKLNQCYAPTSNRPASPGEGPTPNLAKPVSPLFMGPVRRADSTKASSFRERTGVKPIELHHMKKHTVHRAIGWKRKLETFSL